MSKKYVPRFLQNESEPDSTPSIPYKTGRSIVYSSGYSKNVTIEKPLVNTSLPAKEAPALAPATLASLTSNGETDPTPTPARFAAYKPRGKFESGGSRDVNLTSDQEFPSLGSVSKKEAIGVTPSGPSFASMAKEWAKKQKEEEELKKKEDEKNALIEAERRKREKEDRALLTSINTNLSKLLYSKTRDEDDPRFIEDEMDRVEDESSLSDEETYQEEEEPQEYVDDDIWNKRRNKYDMY